MNEQIVNKLNEQVKAVVAPAQKLNKLGVETLEKVIAVQMASLKSLSDLGLAQIKAAVEVKDAKGLQDYLVSQGQAAKTAGDKLVADAKAVAKLNMEYNTEAQKAVRESVEAVVPKAA